jgi:hypothetical protein
MGKFLLYCHISNVSDRLKNHLDSGHFGNSTLQQPGMKMPCICYEKEVD